MATTHPIRDKHQVRAIADYFRRRGQLRNLVLFILGIHTALRVSDLLELTWDHVYDFARGCVRSSIEVIEKKTHKAATITLNKDAVNAIALLATQSAQKGHFVIENPLTGKSISRIQAYRIVRAAAEALQFQNRVSCHSLRKTFGYHAWKSGVSPVVIMEIYNHSSLAVTRRYLGVTQDDKDSAYMSLKLLEQPSVNETQSIITYSYNE